MATHSLKDGGGLTLDSGALIAWEKDKREMAALLRRSLERRVRVTVPAVVLAQVWRKNNPRIVQLLKMCEVEPLTAESAKRVGNLLADAGGKDVIDAAVVLGATDRRDAIVTSDVDDIQRLVDSVPGADTRIVPI